MLQKDLMFWKELSPMSKIPVGYGLNDCPPIKETVPLSIQQIVVLVFNVLPVPLLIGAGIGLSASEITILVAGCLLVTGIATLLQTIGVGPIGARCPSRWSAASSSLPPALRWAPSTVWRRSLVPASSAALSPPFCGPACISSSLSCSSPISPARSLWPWASAFAALALATVRAV